MSFDFKFHFKSCERPSVLVDHHALRAKKMAGIGALFITIECTLHIHISFMQMTNKQLCHAKEMQFWMI